MPTESFQWWLGEESEEKCKGREREEWLTESNFLGVATGHKLATSTPLSARMLNITDPTLHDLSLFKENIYFLIFVQVKYFYKGILLSITL